MKMNLANIKKSKKNFYIKGSVLLYLQKQFMVWRVMPTQTKPVQKIYKLKKRPKNNPLIVHYLNIQRLKKDCHLNNDFIKLYKKFCPGPLTFILNLKKSSKISKIITNKKNTLAVRFPRHSVTRRLLKILEFPLAAPSANPSSRVSAVTSNDVKEDFGKKINTYLRAENHLLE